MTELQEIIKDYNQLKNSSELWPDIMFAYDCTEAEAKSYALSHCNAISFFACLTVFYELEYDYDQYLKIGLDNKIWTRKGKRPLIEKNGYIWSKKKLCEHLGIDFEQKMIRKWKNVIVYKGMQEDRKYQVRIKTKNGKHFIACEFVNGKLILHDTWDRGTNQSFFKHISKKNFGALMEV